MRVWKQTLRFLLLSLLTLLALPVIVLAAQSASSSYQVNEVFFGSGGNLNACGTSYCAKQSAGELAVGQTCSTGATGYCAQAGFNTNREPYIEFTVSNTNVDLGKLTPDTTKTATATFSVKAYLAHGYSVMNASEPPRNNSHVFPYITGLAEAPAQGTEQFGINLVANTVPASIGADPVQNPDSSFGFGYVTSDYNQSNHYKYNIQDIIAQSDSSTSFTDYTISYIFNVSDVTPGGTYVMHHVLVATATY